MKARMGILFVTSIIITMMITGCSSNTTSGSESIEIKSQLESMQKELDDLKEENSRLKDQVELFTESTYDVIISDLETDNYDGAKAKIDQLQKDRMAANAGDINDYLVTIDLNSENFDDYFEFVSMPMYNAFGELKPGASAFGVKSKKYEEGLVIYSVDNITVEYVTKNTSQPELDAWPGDSKLNELLEFSNSFGSSEDADFEFEYNGRITEGKVVYIKSEYVDSYETVERAAPDDFADEAIITLCNGEKIVRSIQKDLPY